MIKTTIPGLRDWRVIVKGPIVEANRALGGAGIHRPYRDVSWNAYGSLHATVSADEEQLAEWFAKARLPYRPGDLIWYRST